MSQPVTSFCYFDWRAARQKQHLNLWKELSLGFDFYKTLHFSLHQPHRAGSAQSIRTLSSENLKPVCSLKITLACLTNGSCVTGKQPLHSISVHKNTWLRWNLFFQSCPLPPTPPGYKHINREHNWRDLDGRSDRWVDIIKVDSLCRLWDDSHYELGDTLRKVSMKDRENGGGDVLSETKPWGLNPQVAAHRWRDLLYAHTGSQQSWGKCEPPALRLQVRPHQTWTSGPRIPRLTGTLGPGPEGGPRGAGAALPGPGEEHTDLILRVGVQMPNFVACGVHRLPVAPAPTGRAVFHLPGHNGPVPIDGVGVELYPQVGGPHRGQLRGRDGNRGLWKVNQRAILQILGKSSTHINH